MVTLGIFSDVAVVITDHLDEESLSFIGTLLGKNFLVNKVNDALAIIDELGLNAGLVGGESISVLGVLGVLLNGGNSAAGSALGRNKVLESN